MASYSILFKRSAEKEFRALPKNDLRKVIEKIQKMQDNPRPHGSELLTGAECFFRIRQGDYRVVYEINDDSKEITIIKVAHRGEVYRS